VRGGADEDREVWIDWYECRHAGAPLDLSLERAWLQLTDDDWKKGPARANNKLKQSIKQHNGAGRGKRMAGSRPAMTGVGCVCGKETTSCAGLTRASFWR